MRCAFRQIREDVNEEEDDFKATKMEQNNEEKIYDEVYSYLTASCYPEGATQDDVTKLNFNQDQM